MRRDCSLLVCIGLWVMGCIPTSSPIAVTLAAAPSQVRSLPILASGNTSLLGVDVPDSHAEIVATVHVRGADLVVFGGLAFQVDVASHGLDVDIQRERVNDQSADGIVPAELREGDLVRVNVRARDLANIAQPEGAAYRAHVVLQWREDVAVGGQTDQAAVDVDDNVAAAVNAGSFALVSEQPQLAAAPSTSAPPAADIRASGHVVSGLDVDVSAARIKATYFGAGAIPSLGLALVDQPAVQVAGAPAGTIAPSDVVDVYTSSAPTASPAPHAAAGSAAVTGDVGGGKALVTIELDYAPHDGTAGVTTDALAFVADLP